MPKPSAADPPSDLLHGKALPPFAALRAFEAVGRVGGVRKAALILSLDHTVVSRHIRFLEEWLGVPLFHRSAGRLTFTETGEAYHQRISAALVELASATSQVLRNDDHQYLRLWCVPGFAAQWLSEQLAEFERLWPESGIELRPTDAAADLIMHQADIDIRFYGDDWLPKPGGKGLRFIEIARPPIMVVANPDVAARLSALSHVSELVDAPLLHEEHHEQWRAWFALNDVKVPDKLQGPLLWHAHLAIAAARQGRGLALASTYLVGQDLANGTLVELMLPGTRRAVIGGYAFVTREDRWNSPAIVKLRRFLQSKVR
jgi:LysR family glycine cleavage system transcriptional activator